MLSGHGVGERLVHDHQLGERAVDRRCGEEPHVGAEVVAAAEAHPAGAGQGRRARSRRAGPSVRGPRPRPPRRRRRRPRARGPAATRPRTGRSGRGRSSGCRSRRRPPTRPVTSTSPLPGLGAGRCSTPMSPADRRTATRMAAGSVVGALMRPAPLGEGLERGPGALAVQRVQRQRYAAANRSSSTRSPNRSRSREERQRVLALAARPLHHRVLAAGRRPRSARPARRRPRRSGPRRRPRAPSAGRRRRRPGCSRTTGTSHFGIRSELSAHSRARVSRTSGLANRSISWCL